MSPVVLGGQARGGSGMTNSSMARGHDDGLISGQTGGSTRPRIGAQARREAAGHRLSQQVARYGELAGRDLSARASARRRARDAHGPQHGDARKPQPLTAAELVELQALAAAITQS